MKSQSVVFLGNFEILMGSESPLFLRQFILLRIAIFSNMLQSGILFEHLKTKLINFIILMFISLLGVKIKGGVFFNCS